MIEHSLHSVVVPAPADVVFGLVAESADWPVVFPPTIHVDHLERSATEERFRIWATAGDRVKDWVSRRKIDRAARVISFRQEVSRPPIASMSGSWHFTPVAGGTAVDLRHEYTPVEGDPGASAWIRQALDANSEAELASLRVAALGGPVLKFSDARWIDGPAELAYRFIDEAEHWPSRLPHVDGLDLTVGEDGEQRMTMCTIGADGSRHTTTSVRIRLESSIVYKQTALPPLLSGHSGRWVFEAAGARCRVTSEHTVSIKPDAVETVLGSGTTLAQARDFVRRTIGGNSRATLEHAGRFAETAR
ncbi:aromatase/cyclase [Amycolatopsis sp. VS8301801F10]|uniref:aromatase/cyclase n=1 Tax=Amycolatopsis sp. VS8301801F10 TaxID=2652442 RepID=UPI0038FCFF64